MVYAPTSYNRSVYAAPAVVGLVFRSLGHSATLHSHAHSRHILPALVMLRKPLFGLAKRHIQPERYVPLFAEIFEIIIDKIN
jgi:hypothetical protein